MILGPSMAKVMANCLLKQISPSIKNNYRKNLQLTSKSTARTPSLMMPQNNICWLNLQIVSNFPMIYSSMTKITKRCFKKMIRWYHMEKLKGISIPVYPLM